MTTSRTDPTTRPILERILAPSRDFASFRRVVFCETGDVIASAECYRIVHHVREEHPKRFRAALDDHYLLKVLQS